MLSSTEGSGTNTGWNVRAAGRRAPNLCGLSGSWFPFARTKADRLASGDPRRSLQERYHDHDGYVRAVERAARKIVDAAEHGDAEVILSLAAKGAVRMHGVAPGLMTDVMRVVNGILPGEPATGGREKRGGWESESAVTRSGITGLTRAAERANNELAT